MKMAKIRKQGGRWHVKPFESFGHYGKLFEKFETGSMSRLVYYRNKEKILDQYALVHSNHSVSYLDRHRIGDFDRIGQYKKYDIRIVDLPLRPYMAYCLEPESGAILIFAYSWQQAKSIAYPCINSWGDCDYFDVRARLMKGAGWLMEEREKDEDGKYLETPHCNDNPKCCDSCGMWGQSRIEDGLCDECRGDQ